MKRTLSALVAVALGLALAGCETIVRNVLVPTAEQTLEEIRPGDEPKGGGHGRGGSKKDTTDTAPPDTGGFLPFPGR